MNCWKHQAYSQMGLENPLVDLSLARSSFSIELVFINLLNFASILFSSNGNSTKFVRTIFWLYVFPSSNPYAREAVDFQICQKSHFPSSLAVGSKTHTRRKERERERCLDDDEALNGIWLAQIFYMKQTTFLLFMSCVHVRGPFLSFFWLTRESFQIRQLLLDIYRA